MASQNAGNSGTPASGESVANDPSRTGVPATKQTSDATATGQQIAAKMGTQHIPKGKEAGSQVPIVGGDPPADLHGKPGKPRGLQAEDAAFVSNGSIDISQVPSPTGLQPIGAVATSPKHGEELLKQRREAHKHYVEHGHETQHNRALDEPTINRLGRAELRAIGLQRGYEMPEGGTRTTRAAFLNAQAADSSRGGKVGNNSGKKGSRGSQARGAKTSNAQLGKTTRSVAPKVDSEVNTPARGGRKGGRRGGSR